MAFRLTTLITARHVQWYTTTVRSNFV